MVVLHLQSVNGLFQSTKEGPLLAQRRSARARRCLCLQTQAPPSRTQVPLVFKFQISFLFGGAGGSYSYSALKRLDQVWSTICSAQTVVEEPKKNFTLNRPFYNHRPVKLIEVVKNRFTSLGGVMFEGCSVSGVSIYEDAAVLQLNEEKILSSRLIIDAMGNFSPIVKQIRSGRKPDGVCVVVGSCARGFTNNSTSDVIYSSSLARKVGSSEAQLFWEAFPAGSGPTDRTTYMFTYLAPQPQSPKIEELLEEYWKLMPEYQEVSLDDLEIQRVLYGIFLHIVTGKFPLPAAFNRVLQFGDASGIQSPVSFGGFGSLTRHLNRLSNGIYEAMSDNLLDSYNLSLLNPYMPNLSSSWLFQRAMSAKKESNVPPDFINELLYTNFQSMQRLGDPVLRPFLQDVVQFGPLAKTLGLVMLTKPQIIPSIFKQVGIPVLLDWSGHFSMLGYYTFLSTFADPVVRSFLSTLPTQAKYEWKRRLEAWKYGAGLDYKS
ncbi:hypothetical protein D8674_035886 [Pyrus ussuriensis x Pyrus communis]|uniref:Uncharacterized protein n=1 Tax=Pyrus ussuriensis x Pyrus communis TaxID=2448454 RepID=A0A5N5GJX3_9ROSA|nr:hypothetical protein D8674_035886 [Pyrus ussuriensis x Pyrus communis]